MAIVSPPVWAHWLAPDIPGQTRDPRAYEVAVARELVLNGTRINDDSAPYVIAEVGNNHQGDVAKGRELIQRASECGASAVKLQASDNETLFTREAFNRPYDNENSFGPTYGLHRQALELGKAELRELQEYAAELKIDFFATPFDV